MQAKRTSTLAPHMFGALALALVFSATSGCQTKNLHASYGLRHKEMQAAQLNARGAHEPQARGEEATKAVENYYLHLGGDQPGGNASAGSPPTNSTAGVRPLVH